MGKSNCLNVINNITNKKEEIHNILNKDEIKILEKINEKFIKKITIFFSNFVKNDVKLNFFTVKTNSYTANDKSIKYLFSNKIEILNLKKQLLIFFSDNLLSVFIDLLFGGNGTCIEKITQKRNITYTEKIIAQKVLNLIFTAYAKSFEKFFSIDMKAINIKIIDIEKSSILKENYITNYFSLSLNGVNIFLSILLPLSIVKKNFQQKTSLESNKKSIIKNIDLKRNIFISNIDDTELDIIAKLIMSSKLNYNSLCIGDVLIIKSPDKIIAYIDKIPIFLGQYKNLDKKSVVFLKKFIQKNLDLNKYEEFFNEQIEKKI